MFIKGISLANYGPFRNTRDGSFILTPNNRLKRGKDTLIDGGSALPLVLVYGQNNSGKTCLVSILKELKIANEESGYVNVPNKYVRTDGSLYQINIWFGNYEFTMGPTMGYNFRLKKDNKLVLESDYIIDFLFYSEDYAKPFKDFLDRIYYLDDMSKNTSGLEEFLLDHKEEVASILRSADVFIDGLDYEEEYGIVLKFTNGRDSSIDVVSNNIRKLLMLMPLFISESPYDVFVLDGFLDTLHPVLQEKIIESHVLREHGRQLIVTTNNTRFLHLVDIPSYLRTDEVYFVETEQSNKSSVTSLSDYIRPKGKLDTESDYLDGRFGAIPFVVDMVRE